MTAPEPADVDELGPVDVADMPEGGNIPNNDGDDEPDEEATSGDAGA